MIAGSKYVCQRALAGLALRERLCAVRCDDRAKKIGGANGYKGHVLGGFSNW